MMGQKPGWSRHSTKFQSIVTWEEGAMTKKAVVWHWQKVIFRAVCGDQGASPA